MIKLCVGLLFRLEMVTGVGMVTGTWLDVDVLDCDLKDFSAFSSFSVPVVLKGTPHFEKRCVVKNERGYLDPGSSSVQEYLRLYQYNRHLS